METIEKLVARTGNQAETPPDADEILEALQKYPYFSALAYQWLLRTTAQSGGSTEEAEKREKIALYPALFSPGNCRDPQFALSDLAEGIDSMEPFYPEPPKPATPSTIDAIDKFLDEYAPDNNNDKECEVIEKLIFNPPVNYAAVLETTEQHDLPQPESATPGSNDDLINRFILENHNRLPAEETPRETAVAATPLLTPPPVPEGKPVSAPVPNDDISLSESLSKIYIKRKNYKSAREIINKLILNYPEKSVYFAVQLRYLDKLIENQSRLRNQSQQQSTN